MQRAYPARINWENEPSTDTPINDTNLNKMDAALYEVDGRVVTFDTTKANQSDLLTCLSNVSYDITTGIFIFTWKNGTTTQVDLNIEKIPVSFSMSPQGVITMTTADGTQYTADVSSLIKTYGFTDSSRIDFNVTTDASGNKQVTADIIDGSITSAKLDPSLSAAISGAGQYAQDSESWAVGKRGGSDVPSTDPAYHNNSKYYAEQAEANAEAWNEHLPYINTTSGNWMYWDVTTSQYVDSGDSAGVSITVIETTTLPAGSNATVTNEGTAVNARLKFGIPQGVKGDQGVPGAGSVRVEDETIIFVPVS